MAVAFGGGIGTSRKRCDMTMCYMILVIAQVVVVVVIELIMTSGSNDSSTSHIAKQKDNYNNSNINNYLPLCCHLFLAAQPALIPTAPYGQDRFFLARNCRHEL